MQGVQAGKILRVVRRSRGWTQFDLAARAGVSQQTVSQLERGNADAATLHLVKQVVAPLGITVDLVFRWKGPELDRLLDARHARTVNQVVARLGTQWQTVVEFTFNDYGDRGSVDILAWHSVSRVLLLIEVKSELDGLESVLRSMDLKLRVVPKLVARERGWRAVAHGSLLVLPDEVTARRAVERSRPVFDIALPARTVAVRRWLREPFGPIRGIWFLADTPGRRVIRNPGSGGRVRSKAATPIHAQTRVKAPPGASAKRPQVASNADTTPRRSI